jgi:phosphoribosylaminoimidazolecarboxamide formyltransferase / IMP cyclohydrolase
MADQSIKTALISVFSKDGLDPVAMRLQEAGVKIISTGGTAKYLSNLGIPVIEVESLTGYPSILDGRVKTLHPAIFGGILATNAADHIDQLKKHEIEQIDLVIVDLYPFEDTLQSGGTHAELIEKIDIGGVSLIRAAAKNYDHVTLISSRRQYPELAAILKKNAIKNNTENPSPPEISAQTRKLWAAAGFRLTAAYDQLIANYLGDTEMHLRYGENPHQKASFIGAFDEFADLLGGKALSYNNLVDTDAAYQLIREFSNSKPTVAIIKHTNACGLATGTSTLNAWEKALAGDPVSAFGGIIACNTTVDLATAEAMHPLFFEVLLAPGFEEDALELLKKKKNRRLLQLKTWDYPVKISKTLLNGTVTQDSDLFEPKSETWQWVAGEKADSAVIEDMKLAMISAKHLKSNTISIVKNGQLLGMGCGQTSRIDALNHAVEKAGKMGFNLKGAVLASDAFFPFDDCVQAAHAAGITHIVQPGGSVNDQQSIDACNQFGISMAFTGIRHFKH